MARRARTFSEKSLFPLFHIKEPPDHPWKNRHNYSNCSFNKTSKSRRKGTNFGPFSHANAFHGEFPKITTNHYATKGDFIHTSNNILINPMIKIIRQKTRKGFISKLKNYSPQGTPVTHRREVPNEQRTNNSGQYEIEVKRNYTKKNIFTYFSCSAPCQHSSFIKLILSSRQNHFPFRERMSQKPELSKADRLASAFKSKKPKSASNSMNASYTIPGPSHQPADSDDDMPIPRVFERTFANAAATSQQNMKNMLQPRFLELKRVHNIHPSILNRRQPQMTRRSFGPPPPRNNPGRPTRRIAQDKPWGLTQIPDEGVVDDYDNNEQEMPAERQIYYMKNVPGQPSEGSVYVSHMPAVNPWRVELSYGYFDLDYNFFNSVYTIDLTSELPHGISVRRDIEGQNFIFYSVQTYSPDYKIHEILSKPIALPDDPSILIQWSEFWIKDCFFTNLYEEDPKRFPVIMIPDTKIYPKELRKRPWKNTILLHTTKAALTDTFEKLSLDVNGGFQLSIWFRKGGDQKLEKWSNIGGNPDILAVDDKAIVTCIQVADSYSLNLLWYFCGPIIAKQDPARHFYKNREWLSTMIFTKADFNDQFSHEWQPYSMPRTTATIVYHMVRAGMLLHEKHDDHPGTRTHSRPRRHLLHDRLRIQ